MKLHLEKKSPDRENMATKHQKIALLFVTLAIFHYFCIRNNQNSWAMRKLLLSLLLMGGMLATAQPLPPLFGKESARTDEMSRKYIMPKRVVWSQGSVSSVEVLLRQGNGQPDMAGTPTATLQNSESDTTKDQTY